MWNLLLIEKRRNQIDHPVLPRISGSHDNYKQKELIREATVRKFRIVQKGRMVQAQGGDWHDRESRQVASLFFAIRSIEKGLKVEFWG
jgi:hypothetical protein